MLIRSIVDIEVVGVLLNLNPKNKSIADLVPELEAGEPESARHVRHQPLRRRPRPARPAVARDGRADHAAAVKRVLEALRLTHDLVVVDCTSSFNDTTLAILDLADMILTILQPRDHDASRTCASSSRSPTSSATSRTRSSLVLNRADSTPRHPRRRRRALDRPQGRPDDRQRRPERGLRPQPGVPFFLSNREAQVSQDILRLASAVVGERPVAAGDGRQEDRPEEVAVRMAMTWQSVVAALCGEKGCRRCPC